ncbi:DinB family protein [Amycolatopsis taiwanensis]|uniref:DinB family protein n=1 Tax=Amycolatopsis taiwanensis TaxID=342230 RepID=A0A9W6R438_9PSEU|nr:DinB family protein [Amycolatopsis taiwanensis]GLY68203.1 hypothetical protein Atai01_48220 [Amycolatopsis taiwanensis]
MHGNVPPIANECEGLLAYLAQQRRVLRITAYGLTDEQARLVPSASSLSIGGLIKHVAHTEQGWMDTVSQREERGTLAERQAAYLAGFRLAPDETLDDVLAFYGQVARETEEIVAGVPDLGRPVPVPREIPWYPPDIDAWSVRWVLFHLIQETARHAGHADIVREHIDGATAFPLMAAAENWPETPWLKPWSPVLQV